ncbi:unnamed protein product [Closterium sp. NIES-54]
MASLRVLAFDHESRPVQFDMWLDDLQLYLLSDIKDGVSLFDHVSGAATAPPTTADSATRSQWLSRDAAARLAIRNHLPLAECAHFGQHRTAQALYDAVVARYSSPTTAALGRLLLPYLFPEVSAFATIKDLVSHICASDAHYRAAVPAEFLDKNQPLMFITLYFIVTRLPDSLRSVRDHFLSLDPTPLTVDLLEQHLLAAETNAVAVGSARGTRRPPFFEGCSPSPLAPSYASAAAADVSVAEDAGAASASVKRRSGKGKGGKGGGGGSGGGGGGSKSSGGGSSGGGGGGGTGGGSGGSGGGGGGSGGSGGGGGSRTGGGGTGARHVGFGGGQRKQQQRRSETQSPQQLREWFLRGASGGSCPYVIRTGARARQTCGRLHTQHRCFSRLDDAWRAEFGDDVELPRWADLLSTAALHDAMVTTTTPGGQRVRICTCTGTGRHLATFTRRLGSSLYTLAAEPPQVAASAHVSTSGQVAASCSCRLLLHQTLLWHHRLGHPSLPRLRGMHSRLLVSGLPRFLPPLPPSPTPPCVEGRQRAAPPSSSFPPMTAPLQTLHMDVGGPARVSGQSRERYFLLVVEDYTRYTTVFPLCSKGQRFGQDLPVLRLHSDKGGEFSSNLLREFCRGEGILQSFTLPDSPQQNRIAECRIGLVMEVARTSMIHAAAPHFLWPFALSAHAISCVFLGFVPDAPGWQFYHPTSRHVFPSQDITFDESVPIYRLFPYCSAPPPPPLLFLAPGPPPVAVGLVAARGAASGIAESRGAEPGGADSEGAETGGAEPEGAKTGGFAPGGVETRGAEPDGVEPWSATLEGAESIGAKPQGTASSGGSASRGAGGAGARGAGVVAGAGVPGGTAATGPRGARTWGWRPGAGGAGAGGAGVGGTGVGGAGAGGAGAVDPGGAVRPRPYFVPLLQQVLGTRPSPSLTPPLLCPPPDQSQPPLQPASPLPALSPYTEQSGGLTERCEPASCPVLPVRTARRVPRSRPPLVPCTHAMTLRPSSVSLRVPLPAPPESSLPEVPDPESNRARAASPTVSRLLATAVTDPSFESAAASFLVTELLEFAAACRLDYAAALVAESESASPPSVGGECALGTDVLEDRQEDFECLAAAVPRFASMLLALEGDPDAPDIPTPRSYAEAITGTYVDKVPPPGANIVDGMWIFRVKRPLDSLPAFKARYVARGLSQRQGVDFFQTFSPTPKMTTLRVLLHVAAQRDYELQSLDFSTAFLQGSLHEEIWLRRPPGFTSCRTTLAALGFAPATADVSLFLRTETSLPPFDILVYVDDLVFTTADTEAPTLVKSELQKRHTCTDLGELRSYLGLQITWDRARRTITLTRSHMVHQVLQRFGFQFSSPQPTPLSTSHSLSAPPLNESVEPSGPYPELVGCLMYQMTCTRPDLAYPLSLLACYVAPSRHRKVHWDAAKRVLRYLCSTSGMGLVLGGRGPVVLTGHANSSLVDDSATQRSSQGYTFSLGSGSVS